MARRPRLPRHRRPRSLLPDRMELDLQDHLRDQRLVPTHGVHYRAYKRRAHLLGQAAARLLEPLALQRGL